MTMTLTKQLLYFMAAPLMGVTGLFLAFTADGASPGALIKATGPAVYYYSTDGKRYVFPNSATYFTWYGDFSGVVTVSDAELASIPIGGNVTYRPGVRLVKITTDPKVYAVDADGELRWVASEAVARALYGDDWNTQVDDIPDAFFTNYRLGRDIVSASDFNPSDVRSRASSIASDMGQAEPAAASDIDLTALPIGDGKYTTSGAQVGYIYSCQASFNGGGAHAEGDWIDGDTWDATAKDVVVDGANTWSEASFSMTVSGSTRTIVSNGLPVDGVTGNYPISTSDDAYQYDRNPNSVSAQSNTLELPAIPEVANAPSCLSLGMIAIGTNGVAIFNGLDAAGRDAAAHEIQDQCGGHPEQSGEYHYHNLSQCLDDASSGHSDIIGYALDGFGLYGIRGESGETLTNADLDECHGHVHTVDWDGTDRELYHYHATNEYPFTLGCYKGTPVVTGGTQGGGGQLPPPPGGGGFPPPPR